MTRKERYRFVIDYFSAARAHAETERCRQRLPAAGTVILSAQWHRQARVNMDHPRPV